MDFRSSLRGGRPPETILTMERGVASRDCGANRSAGGPGPRPSDRRIRRGQVAHRLRCHCRRRQHGGPRPKIATTERREGVPVATGRPAFRSRGRRASHARHKRQECACRRSATPSFGGWMRKKGDEPRRTNAARERRNVRLRTNKTALFGVARLPAPPHPEEARRAVSKDARPRIDLRALMLRDASLRDAPQHEDEETLRGCLTS